MKQMRSFEAMIQEQRSYFLNGHTLSYQNRMQALQKLEHMIRSNEHVILDALHRDLNKSAHEAFTTEFSLVYTEMNQAKKKLRRWMRHKKVRTPLAHVGSKSYIIPEPYGVVAIFLLGTILFSSRLHPL